MGFATENRHLPGVKWLDDTIGNRELSGENDGASFVFESWVSWTGSPPGSNLT